MRDDDEETTTDSRKQKKKERTIFTVWEIDKEKDNTPASPCYESFGNPIPAIRYAHKNNRRNGRFKYSVSPRPSEAMFIAAGVKREREWTP